MENQHYYGNTSTISRNNNLNDNSKGNIDLATAIVGGTSLNFSNPDSFSGANIGEVFRRGSIDNILEELLHDTEAYTDTNTCLISEDCSHTTNNYFHLQSELPSPNEEKSSENDGSSAQIGGQKRKKRGRGERGDNKEAVRKYREKLKARETSLVDEIKKLKASNQQLLKRLESEGALQAEALRLKCLLVDIRGRLEGETSSFGYIRPIETSMYGNGRKIHCKGNCGVAEKNGQSESMVYGQGLNGGDTTKFHSTLSIGSGPNDIPNFGREI